MAIPYVGNEGSATGQIDDVSIGPASNFRQNINDDMATIAHDCTGMYIGSDATYANAMSNGSIWLDTNQ